MTESVNVPAASFDVALGMDLVKTDRIGEAIARWGQRFLHRCFTEREQAECLGNVDSLAARFAGKEATYKALAPEPDSGIGWLDIEIFDSASGVPILTLRGRAISVAQSRGWTTPMISLSHDGGMAVAIVTVVCQRRQNP